MSLTRFLENGQHNPRGTEQSLSHHLMVDCGRGTWWHRNVGMASGRWKTEGGAACRASLRVEEKGAKRKTGITSKKGRSICRQNVSSAPEEPPITKSSQGTRRYDVLATEVVRILPEIFERERE